MIPAFPLPSEGARPPSSDTRRGTEVIVLWLGTLLAIRLVKVLVEGAGLPEVLLAAVPLLFLYVPVYGLRYRGVDPDLYPVAIPAFRDVDVWRSAALYNAVLIGVIAVPWVYLYDVWQTEWLPALADTLGIRGIPKFRYRGIWPSSMVMLVGYHVFFVAIPEEIFYRGYMQSRLDEIWPPRWRVFGATVGPGLLVTCVLFAFGHTLVAPQWWHAAIILPSLVFGWLRARTGTIIAGALFHAWCNVTVTTLDTLYGVVPP